MVEQAQFMTIVVRVQQILSDVRVLLLMARYFDLERFAHHFSGQAGDGAVESGREQQGLAIGGSAPYNGFDVFDEAHIEHAIGRSDEHTSELQSLMRNLY